MMRIIWIYAYIWGMKGRLNLTIDGDLLEAMKVYASGKGMSVSELVENYFRNVTKPIQRKNILDLVDELIVPESGRYLELSADIEQTRPDQSKAGPLTNVKRAKHGL